MREPIIRNSPMIQAPIQKTIAASDWALLGLLSVIWGGSFLFVGVAAFTAVDKPVTERQLITILIILAVVLAAAGVTFGLFRRRWAHRS